MASGSVIRSEDAVLTLAFPPDSLPLVYGRLTAESESLCVVRAFPDGTVYAVAASGTTFWTPGQVVLDSGEPFLETVPGWVAANLAGKAGSGTERLPTGLKAVDLFAPLVRDGRTGIFAEWRSGLLVLIPELLRRIDGPQRFLTFTPPIADEKQWQEINKELAKEDGLAEVWYIPVDAPTSEEFTDRIFDLDAKLILSRPLSKQGIYPPMDPVRSRGGAVGSLAEDVRALIGRCFDAEFAEVASDPKDLLRARFALRFLSQPFFVAEPYVGVPGVWVEEADAEKVFAGILNGSYDGFDSAAFFMKGALPGL